MRVAVHVAEAERGTAGKPKGFLPPLTARDQRPYRTAPRLCKMLNAERARSEHLAEGDEAADGDASETRLPELSAAAEATPPPWLSRIPCVSVPPEVGKELA